MPGWCRLETWRIITEQIAELNSIMQIMNSEEFQAPAGGRVTSEPGKLNTKPKLFHLQAAKKRGWDLKVNIINPA